jgi:hypothetical protein
MMERVRTVKGCPVTVSTTVRVWEVVDAELMDDTEQRLAITAPRSAAVCSTATTKRASSASASK